MIKTISHAKAITLLSRVSACSDAREWLIDNPMTGAQAWQRCKRGDWLLWFAAKAGVHSQTVVLAACGCARLALRHVPDGEDRPRVAIEVAEAWARGEDISLADVRRAARAATADAADAAYAAANAADAYADSRQCATIVRRHIPWAVVYEALAAGNGRLGLEAPHD